MVFTLLLYTYKVLL